MSGNAMGEWPWIPVLGLLIAGALISAGLIVLLRPWLLRYALARPSARGLHTTPTPQGGGIAVLLACAVVAGAGAAMLGVTPSEAVRLAGVLAAAFGLALVGFIDDIRPLPAAPRLLAQMGLMAVGVAMLPDAARVLPFVPIAAERILLVVGGAWFINLTNFMDGMDGITAVDIVPLTAALVVFWSRGALPIGPGLLALGLLAGLLGYAPFNKPVARLFLGDVGSLPIGFLVAYGLFALAGQRDVLGTGGLVAAVLLPLYAIADTGITLVWRLRRGENVSQPHRSHFYQVAVLRGLSVPQVLVRVGTVNVVLAVLAAASTTASVPGRIVVIGAGVGLVAILLRNLARSLGPAAS